MPAIAAGPFRGPGRKVVLAVEPGHRESTEGWSAFLRDLKERGMNCPRLFIGDGHPGIWGAVANIFPGAEEQRSRIPRPRSEREQMIANGPRGRRATPLDGADVTAGRTWPCRDEHVNSRGGARWPPLERPWASRRMTAAYRAFRIWPRIPALRAT
ncbi:MAG: transposase [Candidatus Sericytochromatia bacterium]|nr:transposase [Candidatus Tanganyikabacteria bacterium]